MEIIGIKFCGKRFGLENVVTCMFGTSSDDMKVGKKFVIDWLDQNRRWLLVAMINTNKTLAPKREFKVG